MLPDRCCVCGSSVSVYKYLTATRVNILQAIHHLTLPDAEATQSRPPYSHSPGEGDSCEGLRKIWCVWKYRLGDTPLIHVLEKGLEKHVDVEGLSSSDVASRISQLVGSS